MKGGVEENTKNTNHLAKASFFIYIYKSLKHLVVERFLYLWVTFVQQHAVDALGVHPTRALVCRLTVTAWDL